MSLGRRTEGACQQTGSTRAPPGRTRTRSLDEPPRDLTRLRASRERVIPLRQQRITSRSVNNVPHHVLITPPREPMAQRPDYSARRTSAAARKPDTAPPSMKPCHS